MQCATACRRTSSSPRRLLTCEILLQMGYGPGLCDVALGAIHAPLNAAALAQSNEDEGSKCRKLPGWQANGTTQASRPGTGRHAFISPNIFRLLLHCPHRISHILELGDDVQHTLVDPLEIAVIRLPPLPR